MRKDKDGLPGWVLPLILILLAFIFCLLLESCEVIKGKKTAKTDSTSVSKTDQGAIKTSFDSSTKENQWTKETFVFPPALRDCTVNNNYFPQPTVYIRESGSSKEQNNIVVVDSTWQKRYDSLQYVQSISEKTKETKVLSMWQIIGLAVGVSLFVFVLLKVGSGFINKFTIIKKLQS